MHELTHLKLESEARKAGKNLFFATTATTRETAIRSVAGDVRKWEKAGYPEQKITEITRTLVGGLCEFLFNCPLDMLIERHIRDTFQPLQPAQFLSVRKMALEALETTKNPEIRRLTPRKIFQASLALNGAYGLFLDDLFHGASDFAAPYRSLENFALSQRLWRHWQDRAKNLGPGDEYRLVDEFADMVGLRDWYEWRPDPGHHEATFIRSNFARLASESLDPQTAIGRWPNICLSLRDTLGETCGRILSGATLFRIVSS